MAGTMLREPSSKIEANKSVCSNNSHYEFARKTIDSWPSWKKEISDKMIRLVKK